MRQSFFWPFRLFAIAAALLTFIIVGVASPARADATPPVDPTSYTVDWTSLDPGDDWSAQVIRSVFPVSDEPSGLYNTGHEATVIGTIVAKLTGFVCAIAMAFICYSFLTQMFRGAETSRLLTSGMTSFFVVRLGAAAVLMYPLGTGFSAGQQAVVQAALWGAGMAKNVYATAIQAIGPDAMVIADPIIPGTKTIVSNLIQAELCRGLINAAANTSPPNEIVPEPTPVANGDLLHGGYVTWAYNMTAGNSTQKPVCGSITIRTPITTAVTSSGVDLDMTTTQRAILNDVLLGDIAPSVGDIARAYWTSKDSSSLVSLQAILVGAVSDYTTALTDAGVAKAAELRAKALDPTLQRTGDADRVINEVKLSSLGWSSAGAYYLEFARLNGRVLSLMSAVPTVSTPSYQGLGTSLSRDVMPLALAAKSYLNTINTYVATTDGLDTPAGNADLFTGSIADEDGSSTIEKVFRDLRLNDRVLNLFVDGMSPTGSNWADPFGALTQLGHKMVLISMSALGLASVLASDSGTALTEVAEGATLNFSAMWATGVGHIVMNFLGTPIFLGLIAILIPGLTLAFVIPMIPWVMWMAGVTGWLILVCEAVIAVPLWMLAHMTMQGEGIHGNAREGYGLIFNVLFRPTLMILGLFLSYFIFAAESWLIRMSFGIAAGFVLENGWLVTNILGVVVLLSIFVTTHIVAALQAFRMISLLPHHLPRLIGFSGGGRVDVDQFTRDAALVGVGGTLRKVGDAAGNVADQAGKRQRLGLQQKQLPAPGRGGDIDPTLRAATEDRGPSPEEG